MSNPIVTVNVAQQLAPTPPTLQKTGAIISQGGTSLAANAKALLTRASDLTPLLLGTIPLASLTQAAGLATATMEGTASDVVSGTYNNSTGLVTLTLNASIGVEVGGLVNVSASTGTGSNTAIEGTWPVTSVSGGGTVITYVIPIGLTLTITGGTAKATLGLANGVTFLTTISGAAQSGYNGTFVATVTGTTTFTYAVPSATVSPATGTPVMTPGNQAEVAEAVGTFFAQGSAQGVYVLELGAGTPAQGVAALAAYITAYTANGLPPFYSYEVPRNWDAVPSFLSFISGFESTTSKTYFFVTTTTSNYELYATSGEKSVLAMIEAPGVQAIEFDVASVHQVTLNYAPASTNRVTPLNLAFLSGVTPYPTAGNSALLATLNAANVNVVGTGAAGNLSEEILVGGNMMDGKPFNYWYSVDWVQINASIAINAALIDGSNNPVNPLYYDQNGINRLQQVLASVMATGLGDGLVLNPIKVTTLSAAAFLQAMDSGFFNGFTAVNADPFASYVAENPLDFPAGVYRGFSILYTPLRGFSSIVINVTVSNFA